MKPPNWPVSHFHTPLSEDNYSYWHIKENYEAKGTMESTNYQWYTGTHLYNQKIRINKNKLAKWGRIFSCDSMCALHDNATDFQIPLDVAARDITHVFPHRDGTWLPGLQKFQPGLILAAEPITSTQEWTWYNLQPKDALDPMAPLCQGITSKSRHRNLHWRKTAYGSFQTGIMKAYKPRASY